MYSDTFYPDFSWSHSRDRALSECARAYFWRYYGSHRGWEPGAPESARLAYALKQLTTFPMIVGTAVHECARDSAAAVRKGDARPTFEVMLARVSDALNRAVLGSHHRGQFQRDPKRVVMLRDAWYAGRADVSGLAPALTKARTCLRALDGSALWGELAQCQPGWITIPDGPEAFVHEGWPIYTGPDLVYRPDGRKVVILDWKTGDDSDAELQIPLYALYCRTVLGLPFRDDEWFGRVVNLATGEDTTREITRIDVMRAADRVRDSVGVMHSLHLDADGNQPRPMEEFPILEPERRRLCRFCPFLALCEPELAEVPFAA
ncbi:MAG TPA: PD-(D/E)XK nuclease family protein [Longimicrobium sp.]|nr:PD-(D/E)XK nuclease family protein [Longimicrobium sp.]